MNKQKKLWQILAKTNPLYYICSDKGKRITEEEFRQTGKEDYKRHILDDKLISKKETIIDLGCGIGRMTEFMAKDFDKVVGIDISKEMIKQGRERMESLHNVFLMETDGENIPLASSSIKTVFSYLVFQHVKTKEMVKSNFDEVYRILKPKGLFKVRLRTDEVDKSKWWGGVNYSLEEAIALSRDSGFRVLKLELVDYYGIWLWLEK